MSNEPTAPAISSGPESTDLLINPPDDTAAADDTPTATPRATVVLAHGAGAPMDSPFMEAMARGLAGLGWRVVRFEFPYMARQRLSQRRAAPDRLPVLQRCFTDLIRQEAAHGPLLVGGKSMGGRVASLVVDELRQELGANRLLGCLCLGYPFHPPGRPETLRTEHLATLTTPTLILQGERDSFGRREEVEHYRLSAQIEVAWLPAGDHSFKPTQRSGLSEAENWQTAVVAMDRFAQRRIAT
jgi:predicted alpha/beta-hydrolase family hydrolase